MVRLLNNVISVKLTTAVSTSSRKEIQSSCHEVTVIRLRNPVDFKHSVLLSLRFELGFGIHYTANLLWAYVCVVVATLGQIVEDISTDADEPARQRIVRAGFKMIKDLVS